MKIKQMSDKVEFPHLVLCSQTKKQGWWNGPVWQWNFRLKTFMRFMKFLLMNSHKMQWKTSNLVHLGNLMLWTCLIGTLLADVT